MKIALVHDWLVVYAGAEKVLEQILHVFPEADLYSVIDFMDGENRSFLLNKPVKTSFVQNLPFAKTKYRKYLFLMPLAIEQLDMSAYDLVISSSHAVSKGVLTGPDQIHVAYTHSPIRYAWDLQHQYLRESGLAKKMSGWLARILLHYMRLWDLRTANSVDHFIANSHFISRRIYKIYRRESDVIYPPVDVDNFTLCENKDDYYLAVSRLVPYKKINIIVEAFNNMPSNKLIVIGDGPDFNKIRSIVKGNIKFLGYQPNDVVKQYMQKAKAFIFAAEEDFGITPVEAQACGTPVIAFGRGGALETIVPPDKENPTGIFFDAQTKESIIDAVEYFEKNRILFKPQTCRENAMRFSEDNFRRNFKNYIDTILAKSVSRPYATL
ncbi:MAG: glycosyltransferase family 4 protein [Acidobacteriota bacterium]|jgi:glycosyltransferase involved in cell wall biosynthesis|nr:glycosyltransferase family 4 protein [Acidobacteriota bacterium]